MEEFVELLRFVSYFDIIDYKSVQIFIFFQPIIILTHMQSTTNYFKKAFLLGALLSCSFADSVPVPLTSYVSAATSALGPTSSAQPSNSPQNPVLFASLPINSSANTTSSQSAILASSPTTASTLPVSQNNANRQSAISSSNKPQPQTNPPQNSNFGGQFNRKFDDGRNDNISSNNGNNGRSNDSINASKLNVIGSNSTASNNQASPFASRYPQNQDKQDNRYQRPQENQRDAQGNQRQPQSDSNTTNLFQNSNQAGSSGSSKLPATAADETAQQGNKRPNNDQDNNRGPEGLQGRLQNEDRQRQPRGRGDFEERGFQNSRRRPENDRTEDTNDGPSKRGDDFDYEDGRGLHNINQGRRRFDEEGRNRGYDHSKNQRRSANDDDNEDEEQRAQRPSRRQYKDDEEDYDRYVPHRSQRGGFAQEGRNGRFSHSRYDDEEEQPRRRPTRRYENDDDEEDSDDRRPSRRCENSRSINDDDWERNDRPSGRSRGLSRQRSNLRRYD